MLNGISGNIKGGMLDQKLLFDNSDNWDTLSLDYENGVGVLASGSILSKIDSSNQLHLLGYLQIVNIDRNFSNASIASLPDGYPTSFGSISSSMTFEGNVMQIPAFANTSPGSSVINVFNNITLSISGSGIIKVGMSVGYPSGGTMLIILNDMIFSAN